MSAPGSSVAKLTLLQALAQVFEHEVEALTVETILYELKELGQTPAEAALLDLLRYLEAHGQVRRFDVWIAVEPALEEPK